MAKDDEQLNLLSVFYFVFSGFWLLSFGVTVLQRRMIAGMPTRQRDLGSSDFGAPAPNMSEMFSFMSNLFWLIGALCVCMFVANFACAFFLRQKRYRTFTLVVAGIDCLHIPIGTILGVFTISVLQKDSVRSLYSSGSEDADAETTGLA